MLPRRFFAREPAQVARDLVGARLLVDGVGGVIVETEAYGPEDPASHSYGGPTARNRSMFGLVGHAYVYRAYGLHCCLNVVCGAGQPGGAVLIRAIEPTQGLAVMRARRGVEDPRRLCAGPGRVCEALAVSLAHDGRALDAPPFSIEGRAEDVAVSVGPRIGITRGRETAWRFGLSRSPFLSRGFPPRPSC